MHTVPYDDLYGSMSLFAWLLGVTYLGLEIFHRQRTVGAFVTLWLVVWLTLLELFAPQSAPASSPSARGALFALHVTLEYVGVCGFRAIVYFEHDISRAGPVASVAAPGQRLLEIPRA